MIHTKNKNTRENMKTSENIQELAKALSAAQADIKPASKDGTNPHFKSKFSTLSSVWESIRLPLSKNGLTVVQDLTTQEKSVSVTTTIIHVSGQWLEFGPLSIPISKVDAQGVGSASSYAKRYSLCACLGVVSDEDSDDDGETAVGRGAYNNRVAEVSKQIDRISKEQVTEIQTLSHSLSNEMKENIKKQFGFDTINQIIATDFDKVKNAIVHLKKINGIG